LQSFTAIDFETAHPKRWSICQVGLVRVENGIITDQLSLLVQPPDNFYWNFFIGIHGITPQVTKNEPSFDRIWYGIEPYIRNQEVVAHNGFGFDFPVLANTLEYYGLQVPDYNKHCTYRIYRERLPICCSRYNIPLKHHDALSDAKACAELFLRHLDR
jgi:DNA polymerase III subunit epsilon